ncbi:hypothetical protein F4V44_14200 [Niallia endozanthoxylica]|uniref:DUF4871 domain-containing protein n=2 Tax=Niallia endozanthoxylica TaxID=2036016 RepID=A0A5J5HQ64_9BACI|nr:hypothetical protein F4V44_14200 [Niallia endozanthoxylica]
MVFIVLSMIFLAAGCSTNGTVENKLSLPKNIPDFVQKGDFEKIDWDRTVTEFDTGTRDDMIGNKNKLGIIGPKLQPSKVEKWLWHFWGIDKGELTVVGYNKDTSKITPVLSDGDWSRDGIGGGKIEGADASIPSNVILPEAGKWALLVYIDDKLFDTLVFKINE